MIEFSETYNANGTADIRMVAPALPKAYDGKQYSYTIWVREDGWCFSMSRSEGPGSTRYYKFRTLDETFAHGMKWAKRKIAQAKRAVGDLA
jgi:hypothetical protein